MPDSFSIPRLLMNRLRSVMAAEADTEARLMNVVRLIAGTMVADVCSIYRRTDDDRLELIATEGLREDAINRTFLAIDEGLVGQIAQTAQPLSIQDAPRHRARNARSGAKRIRARFQHIQRSSVCERREEVAR